jgi:replicative DNA helicase Mcm
VGIDVTSGKYDIDVIMTGKPKSLRDRLQFVLSTIIDMEKATGMVRDEDLYERLQKEYDINRDEASRLVGQLVKDGTVYSPSAGYYKRT